jgi:pimeloyl-ACP methyl ester carboxylesterase
MRFPLNATMLVTALVAMLTTAAPVHGAGPDLAREDRWAEQVAPQVIVGDVVWLATRLRPRVLALYTRPSAPAKAAVIVVHGLGVNPDWGVIGVLRTALADRGFATLSVQMPVLAADARAEEYHIKAFPEALERIGTAAAWLRKHSPARLAMISHSMGSWMAEEYLDAAPGAPISAWVCLGITGGFTWGRYFSKIPTLDVYGENDLPQVLSAAWRRSIALRSMAGASRQEVIVGADHFYAGKEDALADVIDAWLKQPLRQP